ncbi:hypothetical protein [Cellulosilyticum lentocellum]|uniref:Lipoprotein n=1 Tax=Cellulosilyticum lentocellum (strain ATCC 49066 / DSM 5427 / NCIMB 11756 / RHM5) TaxID=642492 RepID=F2JHS2_CELLD|nr:hypothetical protein [Cellulosilyticum lentocellum]ADZ85414.1 hypothetical protein Clole_3733 [Cellulosilyticum lentocellum DSM 5427]
MKKFLFSIGLVFIVGCSQSNNELNPVKQNQTKQQEVTHSISSNIDEGEKGNTKRNPFFFEEDISYVKYNGQFLFDDIINDSVRLGINKIAQLNDGELYELKLQAIEGVPDDRLSLGYLYVQEDKIYKIAYGDEKIKQFISSEEIPEGSAIICQDDEIKDDLAKGEAGWHHYLTIDGDKCEYHSYSNLIETDYYESFTWEKGKGLINYRSGFGAERDAIELKKIEDSTINENNTINSKVVEQQKQEVNDKNSKGEENMNENLVGESVTYRNEKMGFSIELPKTWEGKYIVTEGEFGLSLEHNVNGEKGDKLITIGIYDTEQQWLADGGDDVVMSYLKLGIRNGLVFVYQLPSESNYDMETDKGKFAYEEYIELQEDIEDIIGSFKFLDGDYSHINVAWYENKMQEIEKER